MTEGVAKVATPSGKLISINGFRQDFTDFKTETGWFEHLDAVGMAQELADEVGRGTDVEGEVGVVVGRGEFALGVVQRQGAQVVGRLVVGTDDHVGHGRSIGQHTKVL